MANEQNLKRGRLSAEEARNLARRSAEVRREKAAARKSARAFAIDVLNSVVSDPETGRQLVMKDLMIRRLIARAIQDVDLNAIKYVLELIKESPADIVEDDLNVDNIDTGVDIDSWIKLEVKLKADAEADDAAAADS